MKTLNKQVATTVQLQRLNEKRPLYKAVKRQSDLRRNAKRWAEMSHPQRIKFIEKLYWEQEWSIREIAASVGRAYTTIVWYMNEYKIAKRDPKTAMVHYKKRYGHGPNWTGGSYLWRGQYRMISLSKDDPFFDRKPNDVKPTGYMMEHRYVMAKKLGRKLKKGEVVHHKDGNKLNNHPDNLQLMTMGGRYKYHGVPVFCPNCNHELEQDSLK